MVQRAVTLSSVTAFVKNKPGLLAPRLVTTTTDADRRLHPLAIRAETAPPRTAARRRRVLLLRLGPCRVPGAVARALSDASLSPSPWPPPTRGRQQNPKQSAFDADWLYVRSAWHVASSHRNAMRVVGSKTVCSTTGTLSSETNDPIDQTALSSAFSLSVSAASGTAPLIIAPCSMLIAAAQHTGTHGLGKQRDFHS